MYSLVSFVGNFSFDRLEKIMPQLEVLSRQPPLEVHKIYAHRNPELLHRTILVSRTDGIQYHVVDKGRVSDVPIIIPLGDKFYTEYDVERLIR